MYNDDLEHPKLTRAVHCLTIDDRGSHGAKLRPERMPHAYDEKKKILPHEVPSINKRQ